MTELENVKFESFTVEHSSYEVERGSLTQIKFLGKLDKGRLKGYKLILYITEPDGNEEISTSWPKDSGEFELTYGLSIDSPLGTYSVIAKYLDGTPYIVQSGSVTFEVKEKQS